jgi:hypothetical protein
MTTGFEAYLIYRGIVQHFKNQSYDYFKYQGKTRGATYENFEKNRDRYQFDKLARKYPNRSDLENFIVANVIANESYIREMVVYGEEPYLKWKRRTQSMAYVVQSDIKTLMKECPHFKRSLRPIDRQHPLIFQAFCRGDVCVETLIFLDQFTGFFGRVDAVLGWEPGWIQFRAKVDKYKPFLHRLNIDVKRIKQVVQQTLEEANHARSQAVPGQTGERLSDGCPSPTIC